MDLGSATAAALERATAALPGGGEDRPGQRDMAMAVARAITADRHLLVQAGTGTGKSLAYLVPTVVSGRPVTVATATRALQDQLDRKDLPRLAASLGPLLDEPLRWAVLKGRANYLCRQRLAECAGDGEQLALDPSMSPSRAEELARIRVWAASSATGDRAELDFEPSAGAWSAVSVGIRECPGAHRCPSGEACFAEAARRRAAEAQVVVVNQHLLAIDAALGGGVLPPHDLVVVDEAHQFEDIAAMAAGIELGAGRLLALARSVGGVLAGGESLVADLEGAGARLAEALEPWRGRRLHPARAPEVLAALELARERIERLGATLRTLPSDGPGDLAPRTLRAQQAAAALHDDLHRLVAPGGDDVAWVEGSAGTAVLRLCPVSVGDVLAAGLWSDRTAVLTSATLPSNLAERLGLDGAPHDHLEVGSPFAYEHAALLYCAADLPDPRAPGHREALHAELESLITAAGGRTLALFTSWRALQEALEHLRPRSPWPVLAQGEMPKPALLEAFAAEDATSLFATMGFWQGVDVPGATLSLVTIDRLPFPRPDDPLLQARRERAGTQAFRTIDLPRAATMLAQAAGRLIRGASDRGVVAVLDPRLATAATYRWDIVRALPPMRRTRDRAEVEAFLRSLRTPAPAGPSPCPPAGSERGSGGRQVGGGRRQ